MDNDAAREPVGEDSDDVPEAGAPAEGIPVAEADSNESPEKMGEEHPDSVPKAEPPMPSIAIGGVRGTMGLLEALIEGKHPQLNDAALKGAHDMLQYALKPGEPVPKVVPLPPLKTTR